MNTWYEGKTGNHQGLIIEDKSGKSIAVSYDKEDAPLIAAAPEMFNQLQSLRSWMEAENASIVIPKNSACYSEICRILNKAEGR